MTTEPDRAPSRAEVSSQVVRLIAAERLVAGERLGTERDISAKLSISRGLLRQALAHLEAERVIKRLIGRGGGIFVADHRIERELNWIIGVPTYLRQQGYRSRTEVIYSRLAVSGPDEARILDIRPGAPVFELKRLRFANDLPLSLERARLPADRFPHLLEKNLEGSLYEIMRNDYGRVPARTDEYIEARHTDPEEAALLGVAETNIVFEFRRVTHDSRGEPLEHAHALFLADRLRISTHAGGRPPNARVVDPERARSSTSASSHPS